MEVSDTLHMCMDAPILTRDALPAVPELIPSRNVESSLSYASSIVSQDLVTPCWSLMHLPEFTRANNAIREKFRRGVPYRTPGPYQGYVMQSCVPHDAYNNKYMVRFTKPHPNAPNGTITTFYLVHHSLLDTDYYPPCDSEPTSIMMFLSMFFCGFKRDNGATSQVLVLNLMSFLTMFLDKWCSCT
jgi:hypothetical protein